MTDTVVRIVDPHTRRPLADVAGQTGVGEVWVASPRPSPITLAAAALAKADGFLAVGGAQAIAALAYGAGPVPRCDAVVGPGNAYVTAAKQSIAGRVAIDTLAGPSELVVLADASADPATVAADLLAQAEHDPQAVRRGRWKLHFPHDYLTTAAEPGRGGKPSNWGNLKPNSITQSGVEGIASRHGYRVEKIGLSLYNLDTDRGETQDVAAQHPDVVKRLSELGEAMRADLGDALTNRKPAGAREAGLME